jgi:filamentous hemagglutinin
VNEQSGLFAGDGGYHIKADTVDLKGGAITSTNAKNSDLTANALTFNDLENHSSYSASTASVSGSFGGGSSNTDGSKGTTAVKNQTYGATDTVSVAPSLPMSESGSSSSTTKATLTEGNITIGGKTTTAKDLGLNTDAASANTAVNKLPDLKQLLADQKAMAAAAATVIETSQQIAQDVAKSAEAKKKALINVAENDIKAQGQQAWDDYSNATPKDQEAIRSKANADYKNAADTLTNWGAGGDYARALSAVTSIVVGGVAGQGGAQIAGNAAAPYAASLIGQQFDHTDDPNKAAQLLSHAVLGATLAYLNGGNAAAGAAAGAGSEAAAQYLTKELYPEAFDANGNFDRTKLTEAQANHIIGLGAGIGALVGGATGGSVFDGAVGGEIGRNAVENNQYSIGSTACLSASNQSKCEADLRAKEALRRALEEVDGNLGGRESRSEEEDRAWALIAKTAKERCPDGMCSTREDWDLLRRSKEQPKFSYQGVEQFTFIEENLLGGKVAGFLGKTGVRLFGGLLKRGACFAKGTVVHTPTGIRAIENIQTGDLVLSRNENTHEIGFKSVVNPKITHSQAIYELTVTNAQGEQSSIHPTAEHPFWVKNYGWLSVELLTPEMTLVDEHNRDVTIVSLAKTERVETVYNLEVADWNTYFVGEAAVWVHNDCFPDKKALAKLLNTSVDDFHRSIKKDITQSFQSEMKRIGSKNPDIGISSAGNIVLKNPLTQKTIDTGVPLISFAR